MGPGGGEYKVPAAYNSRTAKGGKAKLGGLAEFNLM